MPDVQTPSDQFTSPPLTQKVDGPVSKLSWISKSFLFAELSRLAYGPPDLVSKIAYDAGIDQCEFLEDGGSEAYVFGTNDDCMVVSRGTEPTKWSDIAADARIWTIAFDIGRVHSGFHKHVDLLWPDIEQHIKDNQRPVWFAGHSLGGAMAAVCAMRCKLSPIPSNPQAIFTFGAPRVGNRAYATYLKIKHYRWVNNNDIVPRIPPVWMGYHHMGREIYLNRRGKISRINAWLRVHDRWRGLLATLRAGKLDYLSDHSMSEYIAHLKEYYLAEQRGERIRGPKGVAQATI